MNNDMTSSIILMVLMFAILYFLLIRPQKKKDKQVQDMRNALKVGDEIITIGGILGKIVSIKGDKLIIQTGSERTKLEVARWAISGPAPETEGVATSTEKKAPENEDKPSKPSAKSIKKLGQKEEAPAEPAAPVEEVPAKEE